jgi:hypothetical protein
MIGFLNPQSPEGFAEPMRAFRQGLRDAGYVEGENVAIEYRWADNQLERLPALAAELVRVQVVGHMIAQSPHCGSMPAARMTLPHFVFCSAMKAANPAGVSHCATMPSALKRSAVSGRLKSAAKAALSLSIIG